MPTPKLQTSRALNIFRSDDALIPNPTPMTSGAATSTITNALEDTTKDFIALGINIGDVVYNISSLTCATIVSITSATELELNVDIMTSGQDYIIYQNSPLSGDPNAGCVLYVGTGGDLAVTTAGGDYAFFAGVPTGAFVPVNVIKVWSADTTANNIVALW